MRCEQNNETKVTQSGETGRAMHIPSMPRFKEDGDLCPTI
jgi:hypothetical protein